MKRMGEKKMSNRNGEYNVEKRTAAWIRQKKIVGEQYGVLETNF
jgi:hypothetical protein